MVRIPLRESAGPGPTAANPTDPLRRAVHIALAIYLLPVVVIVCAIGGVAIAFDRVSKLAARFAVETRRGAKPSRLPVAGSGSRLSVPRDRRRIRVVR